MFMRSLSVPKNKILSLFGAERGYDMGTFNQKVSHLDARKIMETKVFSVTLLSNMS